MSGSGGTLWTSIPPYQSFLTKEQRLNGPRVMMKAKK